MLYQGAWKPLVTYKPERHPLLAAVACRQLGYTNGAAPVAEEPLAFGKWNVSQGLVVDYCTRLTDSVLQASCRSASGYSSECSEAGLSSFDPAKQGFAVTCPRSTGEVCGVSMWCVLSLRQAACSAGCN